MYYILEKGTVYKDNWRMSNRTAGLGTYKIGKYALCDELGTPCR
jgi:hypothetical protein